MVLHHLILCHPFFKWYELEFADLTQGRQSYLSRILLTHATNSQGLWGFQSEMSKLHGIHLKGSFLRPRCTSTWCMSPSAHKAAHYDVKLMSLSVTRQMDLGHYVGVYHPRNVLQLTATPYFNIYIKFVTPQATDVEVLKHVRYAWKVGMASIV